MKRRTVLVLLFGLLLLAAGLIAWLTGFTGRLAQSPENTEPNVRVVTDGLLNPVGLAALPDGTLFVAEEGTGEEDESAGVSLITPEGRVGRFISGLPSGRDSGDLSGVALVAVSPDGERLYVGNFGAGHLWSYRLPANGTVTLGEPLAPGDLEPVMQPLNNVRLVNPFDIAFDAEGVPVVTDASGNGVAKETSDGQTRFFHRFGELSAPGNESLTVDPVPTGIARLDERYLVTLLGGCPYPAGVGELVAIDEARNQETIAEGLNMPIDVARADDGAVWVLEFARFTPDASCFSGSGYQANTGRLSRLLPDGTLQPVLTGLDFPGAVLPMPDGSLYISEVFAGRILHVTFGEQVAANRPTGPLRVSGKLHYRRIDDVDAALRAVIAAENLSPNPGEDQREGDSELARLGQALFFDPILSGDQNISCATCHHPALAMADGRVLSIGTGGEGLGPARDFVEHIAFGPEASTARLRIGAIDSVTGKTIVPNPFLGAFIPRNSPTVINSALFPAQFWDGRVQQYGNAVLTLEEEVNRKQLDDPLVVQALFPVTSLHEMAGATLGGLPPEMIRDSLIERLNAHPAYQALFRDVFGASEVSMVEVVQALAAFERQFIFTAAPWDDYLQGDDAALTGQQKRGALLFYGELNPSVDCAACHSGDLFTDMAFHNLLVPQLGPGKGHGATGREDWGRAGVTFDARDRYTFRTPSLRNVELTAPYFHTGAYATLEATIWHHANIWQAAQQYDPGQHLPPAFYSSVRPFQPEKQWPTAAPALQDGLPLSEQDVADLVAFLQSLTDPEARDLHAFIPESVPSSLPLDPLPEPAPLPAGDRVAAPVPSSGAATGTIGWHFRDVTAASGLDFRQGAFRQAVWNDPAAMMGAGLCWIDYDKDGWLDLYLVNSHAGRERDLWQREGGLPRNALYHNEAGHFRDVTAASGTGLQHRGNGCIAADFDADGWTDLYVTADGPNALLWNNGDGTFSEGAARAGVAAPEWNSAAAAGDLNGDGWLDLFVAAYIDLNHKIPKPSGAFPQDYYGLPDRLYLSQGPTQPGGRVTFREVTRLVGLEREERSLGALLSDVDHDGDLDLYIANDGQPNRLYENQPWEGGLSADLEGVGFRFADLSDTANVGDSGSGMGVAGGDYDGDGWFDLFVTNWEAELNALYRNEMGDTGELTFRYSTYRIGIMGLGNNMTGWGTAWADFDQDTDLDLMTVNGRVPVTNLETDPELVRLYGNRLVEGDPGQFREWTEQVGLETVGPLLARGSAVADYDNDGDLDIAINVIAGQAVLLRNEGSHGNWLVLDRVPPGTTARLTLPDGRELWRERHAGSSYLASEDPRLHFGLGGATSVPTIQINYPDGTTVTLEDVPANQHLQLAGGDKP